MLKVENLQSGYGQIQVLRDVSLEVKEGEIVSLLGANGAGKTTTLRTISGLIKAWSGTVKFNDVLITNEPPDFIVRRGLIQVPEGRQLFTDMTVLENLELGAYTPSARKNLKKNLEYCFELFPILKERIKQPVGTMSGGQQQMVAIARGLMSEPKLLILDEPSIGLSPLLTEQVFDTIKEISKTGISILLVEQNVEQALSFSDRGYVLENGSIVLEGTSDELLSNEDLRKAYLGM